MRILVICMLLLPNSFVQAETNANKIDEFRLDKILRDANTPVSVIQEMDYELKEFIYENSGEDIEYVEIKPEKKMLDASIQLFRNGYQISENDLKLKVVAFKNGSKQVDIYPSYEWKKPVEPRGKDYFGYSTHSDFSVVPGERSNKVWYKLFERDNWSSDRSLAYTGTELTGYQHKGSSLGTPDFPIYIKVNAYFRVDIDKDNPVKKMVIAYVHDTTWNSNFSYSVGYGAASISITPSGGDVGYMSEVYLLNY